MNDKFKVLIHFLDGESWEIDHNGMNNAEIALLLGSLSADPNVEVQKPVTQQKKKASEIKSIELVVA